MKALKYVLALLLFALPCHAEERKAPDFIGGKDKPVQVARLMGPVLAVGGGVVCGAAWHEDNFATNGLSKWGSESDPNGDATAASGAYVITHNDDDNIYVLKDIGGNHASGWCQFDITIQDVTGHQAAAAQTLVAGYATGTVTYQFEVNLKADASGDLNILVGKLHGDGADTTDTDTTVAFQAGIKHTIKVYYRQSDNGASNGELEVYFDGVLTDVDISGVDNDVDNDAGEAFAGWGKTLLGSGSYTIYSATTYTDTFDDWEWRQDDCF